MPKYNPKQDIPIFRGGVDGYGDAVQHPDRDSYNWAYNFDCTEEGRAVPASAPIRLTTASTPYFDRIGGLVAWEDATTLRPSLLIGHGDGAARLFVDVLRDGAQSNAATDTSSAARVSSMVLFRHDGSTADNEMVYVACASAPGTTAALYQINKALTATDSGHTISPYGIYVVGSDLWIVSANGYEVQKWTLDTDPGLSGSYGTPIPAGRPTYPINYIGNLGGSPLIVKGDMVMKYDPSTSVSQFIPVLMFSSPDKQNGIGSAQDGRGRIYVPSVDGHLVVFTPGFQDLVTPARNRLIDRDTPFGRISAITCDMEKVYAAIEPGSRTSVFGLGATALGIKVIAMDATTPTDETTDVTDGKFSTVADVTALTTGSTDAIYIGADYPFLGAYIKLYARRTASAAAGSVFAMYYSSAAETFTGATASHDGTAALAQDGLITMQVTGNTDIVASGAWVKTTAYSGSASKYWMKLEVQCALTGAQIREVGLVPYRPPLDADVFPETAYRLAGAFADILVGHWHGESLVWNHVWTLDAARVDQMVVASGTIGATGTERALYTASEDSLYAIPVGPEASPATANWPKLADYGEAGTAADAHALCFSAIDFGEIVEFTGGLEFDMTAVQGDDVPRVYCRLDEDATRKWQLLWEEKHGAKVFRTAAPTGKGRKFQFALQYSDGSRSPMAPVLNSVKIPAGAWAPTGDTRLVEANLPTTAET